MIESTGGGMNVRRDVRAVLCVVLIGAVGCVSTSERQGPRLKVGGAVYDDYEKEQSEFGFPATSTEMESLDIEMEQPVITSMPWDDAQQASLALGVRFREYGANDETEFVLKGRFYNHSLVFDESNLPAVFVEADLFGDSSGQHLGAALGAGSVTPLSPHFFVEASLMYEASLTDAELSGIDTDLYGFVLNLAVGFQF